MKHKLSTLKISLISTNSILRIQNFIVKHFQQDNVHKKDIFFKFKCKLNPAISLKKKFT